MSDQADQADQADEHDEPDGPVSDGPEADGSATTPATTPAAPEARPRVAVIGIGAVGTRLARQLVSSPDIGTVVLREPRQEHLAMVATSLGPTAVIDREPASAPIDAEIVVLATDPGGHGDLAAAFLARGQHVVSTSDAIDDVEALLALDGVAAAAGRTVAVGAGFAPGLSCLLAAHGADDFDELDEIHVAKVGTGGPACARHHHWALSRSAIDRRDGALVRRPGGSGRELCWFPDPIGAIDCYRAALPDALLLAQRFPDVARVTARMAATRRDRLTMRLPMLWPTHPEGGPGGVRVELRGRRGGATDVVVYGAMDRPAVAAGTLAAVVVSEIVAGRVQRPGAGGLAELFPARPLLAELRRRGVRAAVFQGDGAATSGPTPTGALATA